MALFLDSAIIEEARRAAETVFIEGVTTNPSLIAQTGRPAEAVVRDLIDVEEWLVFHQLMGTTEKELLEEANRITDIAPDLIVLKIMVSLPHLEIVAREDEFQWAVTGVASPTQALLAMEAGADFVIPYVNRITRAGENGIKVVSDIAALAERIENPTQILAASLKSPQEVVETVLAGAHHVTLPWDLFEQMARHPVTDVSAEEFERAVRGL